jgi:protein involved in ribonucleotide reduction
MRVSAAGWLYDSIERTREVARLTAKVTHNHPEGIKGAEATASAIYLARTGADKAEIKSYIECEFHYDLNRTLAEIRPHYHMDESCQRTVPEAIIAFLEAEDFEDTIRNAVSLGGDTDTLGAIAGSIAEAYFGIPILLMAECRERIDKGLMTDVLNEFDDRLGRNEHKEVKSEIEDLLGRNRMIEEAIHQTYIQDNAESLIALLDAIVTLMYDDGQFEVAFISEEPLIPMDDLAKMKAGDSYTNDREIPVRIETVVDTADNEWIGVFTSEEELHKGAAGNILVNQPMIDMFEAGIDMDGISGVVINPYGESVRLDKELLGIIMESFEKYKKYRDEQQKHCQ